MAEPLTEKLLEELLSGPDLGSYVEAHTKAPVTLAGYLCQLLEEKGLDQARVVRMADLNATYGYQIFTGGREHPSRDKILQIAFAMALTLRETNRALSLADAGELYCKNRRDAIIIYCIDRGCSLQKVNEELFRFGEDAIDG